MDGLGHVWQEAKVWLEAPSEDGLDDVSEEAEEKVEAPLEDGHVLEVGLELRLEEGRLASDG